MLGALLDVVVTVACLVLMLRAAGWALRGGRPRVSRGYGQGFTGGGAALVVILMVGTVVTFALALVTGRVW